MDKKKLPIIANSKCWLVLKGKFAIRKADITNIAREGKHITIFYKTHSGIDYKFVSYEDEQKCIEVFFWLIKMWNEEVNL